MARTRIFGYGEDDSTRLLNERLRGILSAGVYLGYDAVPGSSGLKISLQMAADPDNTGSLLGKIITPDGVVFAEDEHLVDVVTVPAADLTHTRIDYLVATYTYNIPTSEEEASNDVTYEVVQGTAAATPIPPTLTDDQLLLAIITLPPATGTLTSAMIANVAKKKVLGADAIDYENVLRNGVYTGYIVKDGSGANKKTLSSGVLLTKEEHRIELLSDSVDAFTLTNTSDANHYRYDVVVALHKYEDLANNPPEYIVIEGTEADESGNEIATVPDSAAILMAAAAYDPKYDSADYITKLAILRVQGVDTSMEVEVHHTPRLLRDTAWYVSSGKLTADAQGLAPFVQHYPFVGHEGLLSALSLLRSVVEDYYTSSSGSLDLHSQPIRLFVDGDFHFPPKIAVAIPSFVQVEGVGGATFRFPAADNATVIIGSHSTSAGGGEIIDQEATDQTGVPADHTRWEISLATAAARAAISQLPNGLADLLLAGGLSGGDPIVVVSGGVEYVGWFESYTTEDIANDDWTFRAILETSDGTPAADSITEVHLGKRRSGLKSVRVEQTGTPTTATRGMLYVAASEDCVLDDVIVPNVLMAQTNKRLRVGRLDASGWESLAPGSYRPKTGNVLEDLVLRPTLDVPINLGAATVSGDAERDVSVGRVLISGTAGPSTLVVRYEKAEIRQIVVDGSPADLQVSGIDCVYHSIDARDPADPLAVEISCVDCWIGAVVVEDGTGEIEIVATAARNLIGQAQCATWTDDSTSRDTYVLLAPAAITAQVRDRDEDRNLGVYSDASFTWTLSSEELSWDGDIKIDLPYLGGTNIIQASSSPATLADDGDMLVATLDRDAVGDVNIVPTVVSAANAGSLRASGALILARRLGDKVLLIGGPFLSTGQSIQLGSHLPPDFSITHAKLAADAKAYVEDSFDHWFDAVDDEVENTVLLVDGAGYLTYDPVTGALGPLDNPEGIADRIRVGDVLVVQHSSSGQYRATILEVDAENKVAYLEPGLGVDPANSDQSAIVRGNAVFRNSGLVPFTATQSTALTWTIEYAAPVSLSLVKAGFLFRDGAGNLFPIVSVDDGDDRLVVDKVTKPIVTTIVDELSGSVETNNNPRSLSLLDMKPVLDYEVIGFDAAVSQDLNGEYERKDRVGSWLSKPLASHDKRVVFHGHVSDLARATSISGTAGLRETEAGVRLEQASLATGGVGEGEIEVTAWMTGIAFLFHHGQGQYASPIEGADFKYYIDGEEFSPDGSFTSLPIGETTATIEANHVGAHAKWFTSSRLRGLAPGIHTIRIKPTPGGSFSPTCTGVVLFNERNPRLGTYYEIPGRLYANNGVFEFSMNDDLELPALGSRGGRLIRYVERLEDGNAGERWWVQRDLQTFETTGNSSSASKTLTNVADTSGFAVGDLVRLVYSGGNAPEKRILTAVGASSLDLDENPSVTEVGMLIQYIGKTFKGVAATQQSVDFHQHEQLAVFLPWYGANAYGNVNHLTEEDTHNPWIATGLGLRKDVSAAFPDAHQHVRAEDVSNGMPLSSNLENRPWGITPSAAGLVRFGFVGTGVDLLVTLRSSGAPGNNPVVTLDGIVVGELDVNSGTPLALRAPANAESSCPARVFIAQDLDYGYHVVEIRGENLTSQAAPVTVTGAYVYEPLDPEYDGWPIWESNYLAQPYGDYVLAADIYGGGASPPSGMLRLDPVLTLGGFASGKFGVNFSEGEVGGISYVSTGSAAEPERIQLAFYGKAVSINLALLSGTDPTTVTAYVLDRGHTWVAPSAASYVVNADDSFDLAVLTDPTDVVHYTAEFPYEGLWFIELRAMDAYLYVFDAFVHQTFHSQQRRETLTGHGWMVPRPAGQDARIVRPLPDGPQGLVRALTKFNRAMDSSSVWSLTVYSEGEYWDISCSFMLELGVANSPTVQAPGGAGATVEPAEIAVVSLGFTVMPDHKFAFEPKMATLPWNGYTQVTATPSRRLYLSRGIHVVTAVWRDEASLPGMDSADVVAASVEIQATPLGRPTGSRRRARATLSLKPETDSHLN